MNLESWRNSSVGVKRIHLRVYHFGQNQSWERLWAFFAPKSIGKFWTTSKKEQLLCQYHEWPRIWENKKSPHVQTERVKEERKRKQAKRFDSFNQWWIEYAIRKRPSRYTKSWSVVKHILVKQHYAFWPQRLQRYVWISVSINLSTYKINK